MKVGHRCSGDGHNDDEEEEGDDEDDDDGPNEKGADDVDDVD